MRMRSLAFRFIVTRIILFLIWSRKVKRFVIDISFLRIRLFHHSMNFHLLAWNLLRSKLSCILLIIGIMISCNFVSKLLRMIYWVLVLALKPAFVIDIWRSLHSNSFIEWRMLASLNILTILLSIIKLLVILLIWMTHIHSSIWEILLDGVFRSLHYLVIVLIWWRSFVLLLVVLIIIELIMVIHILLWVIVGILLSFWIYHFVWWLTNIVSLYSKLSIIHLKII